MSDIEVTCDPRPGGWLCHVTVREGESATRHEVTVGSADLDRVAAAAAGPEGLVRASFEFLLEREPKESILRSFDLPVIGRYFPDYEAAIRGRMAVRDAHRPPLSDA